jgi:signal peptidase I
VLTELIAVVALVYFIVRPLVLQTSWIPSGSMLPTLVEHDRILVDTAIYRYRPPRRGEVVVFHPPRSAAARTDELVHPQDFVKRLIGLPGERVRADRDGTVYVNGRPLSERYIEEGRRGSYEFPECLVGLRPTHAGEVELTTELGERFRVQVVPSREMRGRLDAIVPEGHYLMLGDNRDRSDDGHRWGYVPADSAVGRALAVFWPPRRVEVIQ